MDSPQVLAERISALEKLVQTVHAADQKALDAAFAANQRHFEGLNEFQSRMERLEATFVTRTELAALQASAFSKTLAIAGLMVAAASLLMKYFRVG